MVGSGCGGAVLADKLSSAGHEVVVCEEGPYYTVKDYGVMAPHESFRKLYRDYGGTVAVSTSNSPSIAIQQGKVVGGSSVVNGGVCFRTPDFIIDYWRNDLGLKEFTHEELGAAFDDVEKINHIVPMKQVLNNNGVKKLIKVARKNKYEGGQIKRNVKDCYGCNKCVMGCPHDAKQSVLVTYLQSALAKGALILADCKVTKIHSQGDIATGISGYIAHPVSKRKLFKVRIKAKLVIVAASALFSPYLLQKSGLAKASKQLGKNLSLHPASRVYGIFNEKVESWRGAFQTYAIDEFRKEHLHLINLMLPPNMLAATLPGVGRKGYRVMSEMPYLGLFGVMLSDESRGKVIGTRMGPVVMYNMNEKDQQTFLKGFKIAGRMFFEAGARKIYLPFLVDPEINSVDELNRLTMSELSPKTWEVTSAHPMGTCRIGHDPKTSVLDPYHRVHQLKNLYVTDSSAVPSSVAVNPQVTIMGMATRAAWHIIEKKDWQKI